MVDSRGGRNRGQKLVYFVLALVKCTRIYLCVIYDYHYLLANYKNCSLIPGSILPFFFIYLLRPKLFTFLTKPVSKVVKVIELQVLTMVA